MGRLGLAGTVDNAYLCPFLHGGFREAGLPSRMLRAPRESLQIQEVEAAALLKLGPQHWHSGTSVVLLVRAATEHAQIQREGTESSPLLSKGVSKNWQPSLICDKGTCIFQYYVSLDPGGEGRQGINE